MNTRIMYTLAAAMAIFAEPLHADQWGCEVLLCLSNPAGPTAEPSCKPPIHRLWRHLARGHSFPSCKMAKGKSGASYAQQGFSYYDPCPLGTRAVASGEKVARAGAARQIGTRSFYGAAGTVYAGIGTGDGYFSRDRSGRPPLKICSGNKLGVTWIGSDSRTSYKVSLYDRVVTLAPHASPGIIDVYINDAFYQRVRW